MRQNRLAASLLLAAASAALQPAHAQTQIDHLKLQLHGYATQGFLYTTNNNWATTNSSDGSPAWTETVVNLSAQLTPKLRVGAQAHYFLLGDYGNKVTLDWAQADYKVNEYFGVRGGKVKTPVGLFNESQDIDPAHLWILLPQSVYPITDRDAILATNGGVVYGRVKLGEAFGSLQYKAFAGQREIPPDDAYFQATENQGYTLPSGLSGPAFGGSVLWNTPFTGLLFGASEFGGNLSGDFDSATLQAKLTTPKFREIFYFSRYDHQRFGLAAEFLHIQYESRIKVNTLPITVTDNHDQQAFYVMATYRLTGKLSTGAYYSSAIDRKVPTSNARFQKDRVASARYDFNPFLYAKAEQHFIDGSAFNYSAFDNTNLQPNTRMTLLKMGVTF